MVESCTLGYLSQRLRDTSLFQSNLNYSSSKTNPGGQCFSVRFSVPSHTRPERSEMKYVMFLHTEGEKTKARKLRDYLQGRLRNIADLRTIAQISAEEQDFRCDLRYHGDCFVLVGSRHASSLIKGKQQEADDDFLTFDGKVIHEEFSGNREFIDKLIIVYLTTERANDDWIPDGLDEKRIFNLQGEKIVESPLLYQLEYSIRKILLGDSFMM